MASLSSINFQTQERSLLERDRIRYLSEFENIIMQHNNQEKCINDYFNRTLTEQVKMYMIKWIWTVGKVMMIKADMVNREAVLQI